MPQLDTPEFRKVWVVLVVDQDSCPVVCQVYDAAEDARAVYSKMQVQHRHRGNVFLLDRVLIDESV